MIYSPGVLKDNSITTAKIVAGAITQILSKDSDAFNTASDTFVDVTGASQAITCTGGKILVMIDTGLCAGDAANRHGCLTVLRDVTNLGDATFGKLYNFNSDFNYGVIAFIDNPGAGTYTYKLQVRRVGGIGTIYVGQSANQRAKLTLIELKR